MNKSQLEGIVDEAKGKAKEIVGKVTGDESLEYSGKAEQLAGKAKATYEDLKSDTKVAEERTIHKHSLFMFDMDVERLKITPGFNQDKWPIIADIT